MKEYPETHQQGFCSVEQDLTVGNKKCDFGIQVSSDGRIWICIDSIALLRFRPTTNEEGDLK